jgi:hypothetical protein
VLEFRRLGTARRSTVKKIKRAYWGRIKFRVKVGKSNAGNSGVK